MEVVAPTSPPSDDPQGEASILRTGPEAAALRDRMERPARLGRVVLTVLGAVTASAGVAMWITGGTTLAMVIAAFGGILLALGAVQHLLYRRDQAHWPERTYLWTDGLELVLHNGVVLGASWSDPDLALQLVSRRARAPVGREYLLIWLMDSRVPPIEISAEGYDQVCRRAAKHGLDLSQTRRSSRADSTQLIHVHPSAAATAAARAKAVETNGPG